MSGKMIIKNTGNVIRAINHQVKMADDLTIEILKYVGESFVREARLNREFMDDTGNLQSSIGFVITRDKKIIFKALRGIGKSPNAKGQEAAERLAEAISITLPNGLALVGLAGMNYGIYVEARGIDVISGSIPQTQKILKEIIKDLKNKNIVRY